jgi:hypothetical protein
LMHCSQFRVGAPTSYPLHCNVENGQMVIESLYDLQRPRMLSRTQPAPPNHQHRVRVNALPSAASAGNCNSIGHNVRQQHVRNGHGGDNPEQQEAAHLKTRDCRQTLELMRRAPALPMRYAQNHSSCISRQATLKGSNTASMEETFGSSHSKKYLHACNFPR